MEIAPVRDIDLEKEAAQGDVKLLEAFERLEKNNDFKTLILEGFFKTEASNAVLAKALPHLQNEKSQAKLTNRIIGIGEFRQWLSEVVASGQMAHKTLQNVEEVAAQIEDELGE